MNSIHSAVSTSSPQQQLWIAQETTIERTVDRATKRHTTRRPQFAPLLSIRQWLDNIEIRDAETANVLCQVIPARCPFERTISLFDRPLFSIPPLCKLNPFYEQVVGLRFRALCYLADECGQDISHYC
ncbi:Mo-dependent nitrogenase C-terminal domain-containing protein [Stenomitos frigidus]|uniref:Mo-dependent nitrogenase n=1 Tax=Stenomitos frigidus ULC18 TaxID=2107698 RepID=A0A2T1ER72_9CYAN|nr:Mo-dependent nitrogenase C-terminal domain-containing protein [Stenomitos frigidus]PSB35225.1 Mo-dependent nitrogenase [Stenomitos frigidus ULC18]